jgi:hypothetical protein
VTVKFDGHTGSIATLLLCIAAARGMTDAAAPVPRLAKPARMDRVSVWAFTLE